jgi:hypothetical protein
MSKKDIVARALKRVFESGHYCHQWIASSDLEKILRHEFDIEAAIDFGKYVVPAIRTSALFRLAGDMSAANNMYRREHKPKGSTKDMNYVYFLHPNEGESVVPTTDWRQQSITLDDAPLCGFSEIEKKRFLSDVTKNKQQPVQPNASAAEQMNPSTSASSSVLGQASITPANQQGGERQKRKRQSNDGDETAESTATSLAATAPRTPSLGNANEPDPPVPKKQSDDAAATPTTAAIASRHNICRNKTYMTLLAQAKSDSGPIPLNVSSSPLTNVSSQRRKQAKDVGFILASMLEGDPEVMATVLSALLSRGDMAEVKTRFNDKMVENETRIEAGIVRGLKTFFAHHHIKGGTRPVAVQHAVDAVLGAVTFGNEEGDASVVQVSEALGVRRDTLNNAKRYVKRILSDGKQYVAPSRKERRDCVRNDAQLAVYRFCHSDDASLVDTNSNVSRVLPDLEEDAKMTRHPQRVYLQVTWNARFEDFLKSDAYQLFCNKNKGATIGYTRFRESVCKCVKDPTPQSCVDVIDVGLYELKHGIRSALATNPVLRKMLEECQCPLHRHLHWIHGRNKFRRGGDDDDKEEESRYQLQ